MKRKHNGLAVLALLPLLAGCGNTEDFSLTSDRSSAQIVAALGYFDFASEAGVLPNLAITTQRPSENEIVYTIPVREMPNKQTGESTIRITFEPAGESGGTIIHAAVDVPPVRVMMGEAGKALSEEKVEAELEKALTRFQPGEVRQLLVAVAIASNIDYQSLANIARLPGAAALDLGGGDWAQDGDSMSAFAESENGEFESVDANPDESDWGQ